MKKVFVSLIALLFSVMLLTIPIVASNQVFEKENMLSQPVLIDNNALAKIDVPSLSEDQLNIGQMTGTQAEENKMFLQQKHSAVVDQECEGLIEIFEEDFSFVDSNSRVKNVAVEEKNFSRTRIHSQVLRL